MNINLTPILQALVGLLAALITARLIPWIRSHTTESQQRQMRAGVRIAIFAAEQIYGAGCGEEKMQAAVEYLHEMGFDVDVREIEAAVREYFPHPDARRIAAGAGEPPDEEE